MSEIKDRLVNGIIKENPTFVLTLGMCPTLAVTTSAMNGLGMGLTTMVVLALSNAIISALRKVIPDRVRIPAFIVVIASFVTLMQFLLQGFIPSLYSALGIYIPLIVVNCIILGRAESYASKNGVIPSLFDGIGMGLGFTVALTIIGAVREILGAGEIFGYHLMPAGYEPIRIFIMAPGAFFVLAFLTAAQNKLKVVLGAKGKDVSKVGSGCSADVDCANCEQSSTCSHKFIDTEAVPGESLEEGAKRRAQEENKEDRETSDISEAKPVEEAEEKTSEEANEETAEDFEEDTAEQAEDKTAEGSEEESADDPEEKSDEESEDSVKDTEDKPDVEEEKEQSDEKEGE